MPTRGVGYVYDSANLALRPPTGAPINVSAQILRIEAVDQDDDAEKTVYMAFAFQQMDDDTKKSLKQYLQINDPDSDPSMVT